MAPDDEEGGSASRVASNVASDYGRFPQCYYVRLWHLADIDTDAAHVRF
jgi:hypothetical protein